MRNGRNEIYYLMLSSYFRLYFVYKLRLSEVLKEQSIYELKSEYVYAGEHIQLLFGVKIYYDQVMDEVRNGKRKVKQKDEYFNVLREVMNENIASSEHWKRKKEQIKFRLKKALIFEQILTQINMNIYDILCWLSIDIAEEDLDSFGLELLKINEKLGEIQV